MLTIHVNLRSILQEKGVTQKQLAEATGLREATISEFSNNARTSLNKEHLLKIMDYLKITDFNEILTIIR